MNPVVHPLDPIMSGDRTARLPARSDCPAPRRLALPLLACLGVALCFSTPSRAEIILYDGFDYGSTAGPLSGKGGTGGGWSGAWTTGIFTYGGTPSYAVNYDPAGLTFSDLQTTGGSASLTSNWNGGVNAARPHAVAATGTIWGSVLFQRISASSGPANFAVMASPSTTIPSAYSQFGAEPDAYNSPNNLGGALMGGNYTYATGSPINSGQTYLLLFKVTNLGISSS